MNDNSSESGSESTSSSSEESNNGSAKNVETTTENNKWSLSYFITTKPPTSTTTAYNLKAPANTAAVSDHVSSSATATDMHLSPLMPPPHYSTNVVIKHEPLSSLIDEDDEEDHEEHQTPTFPPLKQLPDSPPPSESMIAAPIVAKKSNTPIIKQEPNGKCHTL